MSRDKRRDTALVFKYRLRKVKSCLELKTVRDKKCFYKQLSSKKKVKENVGLLLRKKYGKGLEKWAGRSHEVQQRKM